jgi:hypothetical protein
MSTRFWHKNRVWQVLGIPFCPDPHKTGWPGLGNWSVRFGGHHELVLASVLVFVFASGTLFCSAAISSRPSSVLGFSSPLAEDSLPSLVLPWLLPSWSAEDLSFDASCSCQWPEAADVFRETGWSSLTFQSVWFSCATILLSCWWTTYRNGCLLHSSLHGHNPQQVLTISDGGASVVVPMVCTTQPKEDKVDTSMVEAPTAQTLVARPRSKAPDHNLVVILTFCISMRRSPRSFAGWALGCRGAGRT